MKNATRRTKNGSVASNLLQRQTDATLQSERVNKLQWFFVLFASTRKTKERKRNVENVAPIIFYRNNECYEKNPYEND